MNEIRYVHTNIVAENWRILSEFYIDVFGCRQVEPERDLCGDWIDALTGLSHAHIQGMHLALPGFAEGGPTLEIFSYDPKQLYDKYDPINRKGFAHIAFHVDSVDQIVNKILDLGGSMVGSVVVREYRELENLTVAYCRDPEGNCIEIQNWNKNEGETIDG